MARPREIWHLEDIKAELRKRHGAITHLSVAWGYSKKAISKVLADPCYSRPLERRIARALGVKPQVLWPERWDEKGATRHRSGNQTDNTPKSRKSCQLEDAA